MSARVQFRLRIGDATSWAIGPGKVALLEAIDETGSISAAARKLKMSYKRAWDLVSEMNESLVKPALLTAPGGRAGGGTTITPVGRLIIETYREIEQAAASNAAAQIQSLKELLYR